jgi:glycosyltransferase involved in cell wall biosynthesis
MSRPALAYVANSLNPGGTEKLVVEMGLAFAREFDLEVFCLDEPGAWAARLRDAGIPVIGLWRQPGIDLSVPGRLAAELRRSGARIVHAHQCSPWFYAALSRLRHHAPKLLLEEHGRFWPEPDSPKRRAVNRWLINRLTDRFVAVSQDIATRLERYEGIPADRIEVIYNGVAAPLQADPEETARRRAALGFAETDVVIGTVGRFDPIKNLPMLVDALAELCRSHANVRGLLIGDGPQREAITRRVREAGMEGRIVLTGHRDDARMLMPCMDLFVLASFSEGTSVALLEAMSAGLPAAVTAVGGNPEIVLDGQTGWVVPSNDTAALHRAFAQAHAEPSLRRARGEAARRRFESRFTSQAMLDAYAALYDDLLGGAGRSTPARRGSAAVEGMR